MKNVPWETPGRFGEGDEIDSGCKITEVSRFDEVVGDEGVIKRL